MSQRITTVSEQPDLASIVAQWRVDAFFDYPGGFTAEEMQTQILEPSEGPKETFVVFDRDRPVGTVALIRTDMETQPDLTPWFADPTSSPRSGDVATRQR